MLAERTQMIRNKVAQLVQKASHSYGVNLPTIDIRFDLKGRVAGWAGRRNGQYFLRFNTDMIQNNSWDHLINDTVPHEVAHLVCFFNPQLGSNHNRGWARVCRTLGGTGARCHRETVTYANGKTYYYTTSTGHTIALSSIRHRKVQQGGSYLWRGKGKIDRACAYSTTPPTANTQPTAQPRETFLDAQAHYAPSQLSKADQIRNRIREAKTRTDYTDLLAQHEQSHVTEWAVRSLGMSRTLARTYVKNNWSKA